MNGPVRPTANHAADGTVGKLLGANQVSVRRQRHDLTSIEENRARSFRFENADCASSLADGLPAGTSGLQRLEVSRCLRAATKVDDVSMREWKVVGLCQSDGVERTLSTLSELPCFNGGRYDGRHETRGQIYCDRQRTDEEIRGTMGLDTSRTRFSPQRTLILRAG